MSAPHRTPEAKAAAEWLNFTGFDLRLTVVSNDPRALLPDTEPCFVAAVDALRALVEPTPSPAATPCPDELVATTRRSLAAGMRHVIGMIETLRRGSVELRDDAVSRRLFAMQQDLAAMIARLS